MFQLAFKILIFKVFITFSICTNSCSDNFKFSSKSGQFTYNDLALNLNIEFIDICYGLKHGLKPKGNFYLLETSMPTDDRFISFLKTSLKQFGFRVDNVLGKGNYGVVFAAKSEHYGNVAIKIAANKDGAFYDFDNKQECCYTPSNVCQQCSKPISQLVPFEVANSVLALDADGVVKNKAFGIITTHSKLLFYIIVMEKIENSMSLLSFTQQCFKKFNKDRIEKHTNFC